MEKKILEVFRTACDAYLEFRNNFLTLNNFARYYNLDREDVDSLYKAYQMTSENNGIYKEIDYYYQKLTNKGEIEEII